MHGNISKMIRHFKQIYFYLAKITREKNKTIPQFIKIMNKRIRITRLKIKLIKNSVIYNG